VAGELPALVLKQAPAWMAFLDVAPLSDGHVLLIPTEHHVRLESVPADLVGEMASVLPSIGRAVLEATGAAGYNILQNNGREAGQVVQHVHFHVIPRHEGDGLGYRWHPKSYPQGRAEELHAKLTALLGK
jgi:histidine triad (HIT) family protein